MKTASAPRVCLIEDDVIMGESLRDRFSFEGFDVVWHQTAKAALHDLQQTPADLLVSDIRLPDMNGDILFEQLQNLLPRVPPALFITAYGTIDDAVKLLRLGAADYITKPFQLEALIAKMRSQLPAQLHRQPQLPSLGVSDAMHQLEAVLLRLAGYDSSVLISGESGVGKEVAARRLHALTAKRAASPFVAVNCAALPETLAESELFGHEKGAFTGATALKRGFFEQAGGGTLFLDEISELPMALQGKLLRATQDSFIVRLGGERNIAIDVRLIYTSNRDLHSAVEAGRFREDLYYRINVIHLRVPPLRERVQDIPWLAGQFLNLHNQSYPQRRRELSAPAQQALLEYAWPGNVRELKNCIERACVLANSAVIEAHDLFDQHAGIPAGAVADSEQPLADYLQQAERQRILQTLVRCDWRIADTAQALGISRKTLWEKMKKLAIQRLEE